jgi:hypothetical protein
LTPATAATARVDFFSQSMLDDNMIIPAFSNTATSSQRAEIGQIQCQTAAVSSSLTVPFGASLPLATGPGQLFVDTQQNLLWFSTAAGNSWIPLQNTS